MYLSFRQGIVQHEQTGFLTINPTTVSLVVIDTPTIITISSGTKDYLHIERESIPNAWTSITPGIDQWLYWDIHTTTGVRTFGVTLLNPISQPTPPTPITDQHWFDTTTKTTKVWNGVRWVEKLRVFACKLSNGSVPISMSSLVPIFTGTQTNLNESGYVGQIMFDSITGNVLKAGNKFVTTEDVLTLQSLTKSDVKFASMVVRAEAQQPMDAYTIVKFIDFGRISYADAFVANRDFVYGMIQQPCLPGDVTNVVITGVVTNPDWDWSPIGVNAPLYCSPGGTLVSTPSIPRQIPVATVLDTKTIILSTPRSGSSEPTTVVAALDDLTDVTITTPANNQFLKYNGTSWVNDVIPTPASTLDDLTDVTITTPANNQFLKYDGTAWVNSVIPTPASTLDDLTDVTITTPANNQVLQYNGTGWVNSVIPSSSPITWNAADHTLYGPTLVTGTYNFVYGDFALSSNTLGSDNIAIGSDSLHADPYALRQVAVGNRTLFYNETPAWPAADNVEIGVEYVIASPGTTDFTLCGAPNNNPGTSFIATGIPTGDGTVVNVEWDCGMIAIGYEALYHNSAGWGGTGNLAVGYKALYSNTSGASNVAIGRKTMWSNTTGQRNIAIGDHALFSNVDGSINTVIGDQALYSNTTGTHNVAIGQGALFDNTTGIYNTAIGKNAGTLLSTGSNNTLIGGYQGTAGMDGNVILSTGDGTIRFQHDGTNWTSATPISTTGLILPDTTSPITLNSSTGTAGQVLTSAGPGATPTWTTPSSGSITLTGDVTGSGTGTFSTSLSTTGVIANTYTNATVVVDSKGRITSASNGVTPGSVTSVSVTTANGVSGSVATATTTPAITLTLGDITPTSVTSSGRISAVSAVVPTVTLSISAGTVSVDASLSNNFEITANANFTLNNPTNLVKGMIINFEFIQDATGSRTITYGTMYKFPIDSDRSLSTSANTTDFMSCYYNGTSLLCSLGKRFQ